MNEQQRISLETAKLAKAAGFNWGIHGSYTEYLKTNKSDNPSFRMTKGEIELDGSSYMVNNNPALGDLPNTNYTCYSAPYQATLQKWLREKHDIHILVEYGAVDSDCFEYNWGIKYFPKELDTEKKMCNRVKYKDSQYPGGGSWKSYEIALEDALQNALNLIEVL